MKKRIAWLMSIGFGVLLLGGSLAAAAQESAPVAQEGVEVLMRGPMHEAYAAPQSLDPKPSPVIPKQPPDPIQEMPPDQKPEGSHVVWISGYWAWDDATAQFAWISGFWRDLPPGKRWVPGHWSALDNGWQWTSGFWAPEAQTQLAYLPPPPPTLETGPTIAAPAADQFYCPGCWVHVDQQYRWRPGFWLAHRPNWVYVPAHYEWTPVGCLFVEGYWDYELTKRGLLFCPIRFTANVWARPGWRLLSRFIVYPEILVSSLFVRADYHCFCFGDFFGAKYIERGFVPWVDYRLHANIPLPLFSQFAWAHRTTPNWERDLRKVYDDRRLGLAPRPPHNLAEQAQFMRDLAAHKEIRTTEKNFAVKDIRATEKNLTMVNTLNKLDRKEFPLKAITPAAHAEALKSVEHYAAVNTERKAVEKANVAGTPPVRLGEAHPAAKLPVVPAHLQTPHAVVTPAAPVVPAHVARVVPKYEPPRPVRAEARPLHH